MLARAAASTPSSAASWDDRSQVTLRKAKLYSHTVTGRSSQILA